MTSDHREPEGTWRSRGAVEAVCETLLMGIIDNARDPEDDFFPVAAVKHVEAADCVLTPAP